MQHTIEMSAPVTSIPPTTRPLRVCHISTVHPLHDPRIFYLECWSQVQAGHEVTYLVQSDQDDLQLNGVRIRSVGKKAAITAGLRLRQRLSRFAKALKVSRSIQADVYHIHDPELIPLAVWLRLRTGAVVIFDAHEDDVAYIRQKTYLHRLLKPALLLLMQLNVRLAARGLNAIVVCDPGVANLYRHRYGAKHVVIAHNFPRLDVFSPPADDPPAEKLYDLVYHGTIPRYHLEIAFNVADVLKRRGIAARWLFFGSCPYREWAQREIDRRGLRDYVTVEHGWIQYDQVVPRLKTAKIGFIPLPDLPKFQTNIPSKLFEFMALGMPTILSDLPPSRPFVGDGKCAIMVKADDYEAYADAITRLLEDPVLCTRMGAAARERIEREYHWEREAVEILSLYERLTAPRVRASTDRAGA